jgi:hypothetical protein
MPWRHLIFPTAAGQEVIFPPAPNLPTAKSRLCWELEEPQGPKVLGKNLPTAKKKKRTDLDLLAIHDIWTSSRSMLIDGAC